MHCSSKSTVVFMLAFLFVFLAISSQLPAADHVVSSNNLRQALLDSAATRQKNILQAEKFFSSPLAQKALKKGGLNLKQVEKAIPSLSNKEVARLAKQTDRMQNNFAAAALSNQELTYIVIALATAIIVILIVKA
ncbi:MAG: PA2779 family protein [Terriglobia bacterium]